MSEEEKDFSVEDFAIGLVSGLLAGAAIAALFAPVSGPRTRQKIQDWFNTGKQSAGDLLDKGKDALDKGIQTAESALGLQEKGLKKRLEQIKSELERFDLSS